MHGDALWADCGQAVAGENEVSRSIARTCVHSLDDALVWRRREPGIWAAR